jgi:hypothetical protein
MKTNNRPISRRITRQLISLSAILTLCAGSAMVQIARAQAESGSAAIEGVTVDGNGAAVSGATVTIRNVETGLERTAATGSNGRYSAPVLPVGRYSVKVEVSGFGPAERDEVRLRVGETATVDFTLKPASVTEKVTVTSDPETLIAKKGLPVPSSVRARCRICRRVAVTTNTSCSLRRHARIRSPGLVMRGQRSINSNVAIDGADFNDSLQTTSAAAMNQSSSFPDRRA